MPFKTFYTGQHYIYPCWKLVVKEKSYTVSNKATFYLASSVYPLELKNV